MNVVERNLQVVMVRPHLDRLPRHPLPAGVSARWYEPGDERLWLDVERRAERYVAITPELFAREFGQAPAELPRRMLFLCNARGDAVATATAWFAADYHGAPSGRVHWVAVVPEQQGVGLGRPLLGLILARLRELGHDRAYLVTHTARVPAIRLYARCGFVPDTATEADAALWREWCTLHDLPPPWPAA